MADREYDSDLVLWAEDQARALRNAGHAGTNLPIDWENVAEEIEALGKSQGRELASRIRTIVVHLIKLEVSPATEPRAGWRATIQEQRNEIEAVLADSPSLHPTIQDVIATELSKAKRVASLALAEQSEQAHVDLESLRYTAEQVVEDWFPDQA
jgi:hypothetical protein